MPDLSPALSASPVPIALAVDLSNLRPGGENGGIKPFLFETLLWLGRQRQASLRFIYLTGSSTHDEVRDELARVGDEVVCVRDHGGEQPEAKGRIPRERMMLPPPADLLWQLGAQVLYCPFGTVDFALPGIATIATIVDVLHRDFSWSLDAHHNAARERTFQDVLAVADLLQCNSAHVVSRLQEHYAVPVERTFTVYNAVHGRFAALTHAIAQATAHFDHGVAPREDAPFFFYPANAWKHKNHEVLLTAYGIYRARAIGEGREPWPLILTGHEDARWEEVRALAGTLDLLGAGAVQFRGYVAAAEFGALWESAGALVFPSLHEGFGIPLLEAMEHDVPVLSSCEGSLPEVGADACLFVDARSPQALATGMTRLATDAALRQRLIEAGRRRLADFSQDQEAGRLLDAIVLLANQPPVYRPFTRGIFPDGWTEHGALVALPSSAGRARLTLRFHPLPAPRRLRLRLGKSFALGAFDLPTHRLDHEIAFDLYPDGVLSLEVPNAASLGPADSREHGVRLSAIELHLADGTHQTLFAAP